MTQENREVDLLIRKVIQNEMKNSPPPMPVNKVWEQLESRLNDRQPNYKRSPFYKNKLFYAVAIIFISVIIFLSPQSSGAYSTIVEVFQKVQENVTQLFIKVEDNDPPGEAPPLEDDMYMIEELELITLELSIEDAQKETAFIINQPQIVPEGYTLRSVTVFKSENEQSDDIFLNYEGTEGHFDINQRLLEESFSAGVTINNDDAQIDTIDIRGRTASLLQHENDFLELIWVIESHYYSISGMLSREEIIEIAESI